jgi:hypothetical protein
MTKTISIPLTGVQITVILAAMFDVVLFFLITDRIQFLTIDAWVHVVGFGTAVSFDSKSYHYFSYGLTLLPKIPVRFKLKSK